MRPAVERSLIFDPVVYETRVRRFSDLESRIQGLLALDMEFDIICEYIADPGEREFGTGSIHPKRQWHLTAWAPVDKQEMAAALKSELENERTRT